MEADADNVARQESGGLVPRSRPGTGEMAYRRFQPGHIHNSPQTRRKGAVGPGCPTLRDNSPQAREKRVQLPKWEVRLPQQPSGAGKTRAAFRNVAPPHGPAASLRCFPVEAGASGGAGGPKPPRQPQAQASAHARQPDPAQFGSEDGEAPLGKKGAQAEGRNPDGPPRAKMPGGIEGPEGRHAQPAVGHGIKEDMARHGEKADAESHYPPTAQPWRQKRPDKPHDHGEKEGMRETPVPQKVRVTDAETEADDVRVGQDGADHAEKEHPGRKQASAEDGPERQ